jgi:hypothetical protein
VSGARVHGVELADGTVVTAPIVLSCAPPATTLYDLLEAHYPGLLPPALLAALASTTVASGSAKINVALGALPNFLCKPNGPGGAAQPHHRGTIHFGALAVLRGPQRPVLCLHPYPLSHPQPRSHPHMHPRPLCCASLAARHLTSLAPPNLPSLPINACHALLNVPPYSSRD